MPVTELRIQGYRSIRDLTIPLKRVNIIVGPNGCGKSNLYRSVSLLRAAADGQLARALADEGGMPSVLWAGPRKVGPERLVVGVTLDEYDYELTLGLPQGFMTMFGMDPRVKSEKLYRREGKRRTTVVDRSTASVKISDIDGNVDSYVLALSEEESVLSQISNPRQYPLLDDFRRRLLKWRFYHGFRTDEGSPIRRPQVATRTYVLSSNGFDLAGALQTIRENGDDAGLANALEDAFPGSSLTIFHAGNGLSFGMETTGINRSLGAHELSDGTLRYLCLLAALLSPRPAPLLALNEPETSLHESLLPPLARLIARACDTSQVWLTTHSTILADQLSKLMGVKPIGLDRVDGETVRAGRPKGVAFSAEYDL